MTRSIRELEGRFSGATAWIVGKGPSLATLSADMFGDGPVISLNQAIVVVERLELTNPLYAMQKGFNGCNHEGVGDVCPSGVIRPRGAVLVLHEEEGRDCFVDYEPRYLYSSERDYGLPRYAFSTLVATAFAIHLGCTQLVYMAMDAMTVGDTRTYLPRPDGCDALIDREDWAAHYKQHRALLERYLVRWNIPHRFAAEAQSRSMEVHN